MADRKKDKRQIAIIAIRGWTLQHCERRERER
jgi:hypothetical protein